ncbi:MAG: hypothetical protein H6739_28425 [Alphaproteobacteria bacterium]|nr:hypothetical protein [Alphaproteobacteria bacterium]
MAVAGWAARRKGPVAWLALDPGLRAPALWLSYLLAAFRRAGLPDGAWPPLEGAVDLDAWVEAELIVPLSARREPTVLVVDDADHIPDPACQAALDTLLRAGLPRLRVVLTGRRTPALPPELLELARRVMVTDPDAADPRAVLAGLSPARRALLEATAPLHRFDAALAADLGAPGAEQLRDDARLIEVTDEDGPWFRVHPLLREALLSAQAPERVRGSHGRAARALAARGLVDDALEHLDAADDPHLATALAQAHGWGWLRAQRFRSLARLLSRARGDDPELDVLRAWVCLSTDPAAFPDALARARRAAGWTGRLALSVDTLEALIALRAGRAEAGLAQAERVLSALPHEERGLAVAVHLAAAFGAQALDRLDDADAWLARAALHAEQTPALRSALLAWGGRARLCRLRGQLDDAEAAAERALALAAREDWVGAPALGVARVELGMVLWGRGALPRAEAALTEGLRLLRLGGEVDPQLAALMALAHIRYNRGDRIPAAEALIEAESVADARPWTAAFIAVERCRQRGEPPPEPPPLPPPLGRLLALETAWAASDTDLRIEPLRAAWQGAADLPWYAVPLGAALAAALAPDQPGEAARVLDQTARLATPGRLVGPFLAHARALRPLVRRVPTGPERALLLDALGTDTAPAPDPPPEELLSPRELEVLDLVARGLPNRLVARRLFISPDTVRTHVHTLLRKLGAHNRTEAAHRARALGLIP